METKSCDPFARLSSGGPRGLDAVERGPSATASVSPPATSTTFVDVEAARRPAAAAAAAAPAPKPHELRDPLMMLFSLAPAAWGNVSFGQYVLHFIAYHVWPLRVLGWAGLVPYFIFLLAISYLSAKLITEPGRRWWLKVKLDVRDGLSRRRRALQWLKFLAPPTAVACLLLLTSAIYHAARDSGPAPLVAAPYIECGRATDGVLTCVDVRLNWTSSAFSADDPRAIINPSMLFHEGRLVRAARAHALVTEEAPSTYNLPTEDGRGRVIDVTLITNEWRSDLVGSDGPGSSLAGWEVDSWGLDGAGTPMHLINPIAIVASPDHRSWGPLCEHPAAYDPVNATLTQRRITGAEDPKLVALPPTVSAAGYGLAFSSLPPQQRGTCEEATTHAQMYMSGDGPQLMGTTPAGEGAVTDGTAAEGEGAAAKGGGAPAARLQCGAADRPEKNWIAFTWEGRLLYVYSIYPHRIVEARAGDGACVERREYETSGYEPLAQLERTGYKIHGSATAVRYDEHHFLALLHTIDPAGTYATFAYKFAAAPPFAVVSVSAPLPLQGGVPGNATANFASGLATLPADDKIVVTYGADDRESRALVLSTNHFESLFDCDRAP